MVVGLAVGAGGMYLGLERPWATGDSASAVADAGPGGDKVASGKKRKKRKKRKRRKSGSGSGGEGTEEQLGIAGDDIPVLTAADRKLVWRGDAVELPQRDVDFGSGGGGRALDQSEINEGIATGSSAVVRCIGEARGYAEISATITAKFLVEGGRPTKVRVRAPQYLMDHGFASCARKAVKQLRFANTGVATVVAVPFDLK